MSEVIVRMEMPKNCFECNFHCVGQFCDGMGYCSAVPPYCDNDCRPCEEKRPDWCPIVGVLPEQHGDLVDADTVLWEEEVPDSEGIVVPVTIGDVIEGYDVQIVIAAERKDE